eukprot:GFUD01000535.1.p1 GENE.GFUD01000535.1~~GFUD01000535.1.p1  ORF type:complete len:579 (-),score=145.76 GFUD01000535.1:297-2033(-)
MAILGQTLARVLPSRPCRRTLGLITIWTCFCWVVFRVSNDDHLLTSYYQAEKVNMNTRELLGRIMTGKAENNTMSTPVTVGSTTESGEFNILEAVPYIDRSPKLSEADLVKKLQPQMPNLPIVYWQENKKKKVNKNSSCTKYPDIYDLHFNNKYWQVMETSNGTFHLYGAYLDVRSKNRLGPTVRILGMINRLEPKVKTFCQLWFSDSKEPVFSKVLEYKYIWYKKWGNYKQGLFQPYLLACQLPKTHWGKAPASVSIVENQCDTATINLRVIHNKPEGEKKKFAVCVKGMDFPDDDLSVRLVEWIELLNTLGADKIFLYNLEVHPNVTKVLDHYSSLGLVDVTPISLPGYQPNLPVLQHMYLKSKLNNKRQNELIPYNDCLYRNMYRYEYIALLDIDEVIMPIKHNNWADMMKEVITTSMKVKNETRASWNFRNVYFMDEMLDLHEPDHFKDIPPYLHMMQHVYRSANYTKPGQYVKCFHNPEKALILHNHFPLGCLGGVCTSYPVDTSLAHLQHYRQDCVSTLKKSCKNDFKSASVKDTTIWKWKDAVIGKTTEALQKLGFFGTPDNRNSVNSVLP